MKNKKRLVSFIIPAYNTEKYLESCIDSLIHQTVLDHKIIIVNDGSSDKTEEIAQRYTRSYPEIITYLAQENQGLGATRNRALSFVDTEYVAFLDSDDCQECMFVEKLRNELARHENVVDIVFSLPWNFDTVTQKVLPWRDKQLFEKLFYPHGGYENVISVELNVQMQGCTKLYDLEASQCRCVFRADFLRSIGYQFLTGVKWEDVWPHFSSIHHAKCCIGLKNTGFIYRINTSGQLTSGGGASRLDVAKVFRYVLDQASAEKWAKDEIAHIIYMLFDFTKWTISVTNSDYITPVLDGLHQLYRSISRQDLKVYYRTCCNVKRDKIVIMALRSPFYKVFRDYRSRQIIWAFLRRFYRVKNLFRR